MVCISYFKAHNQFHKMYGLAVLRNWYEPKVQYDFIKVMVFRG